MRLMHKHFEKEIFSYRSNSMRDFQDRCREAKINIKCDANLYLDIEDIDIQRARVDGIKIAFLEDYLYIGWVQDFLDEWKRDGDTLIKHFKDENMVQWWKKNKEAVFQKIEHTYNGQVMEEA